MSISEEEYLEIVADDTKMIDGDIFWEDDLDHSQSKEFRMEVESSSTHSMFIQGRYIPLSGKLSYAIIHRSAGRIYGLDLGAGHRNPDGKQVGDTHKNYWRDGSDRWAYEPEDITESWNHPVEVWEQFCAEANLRHRGRMIPPNPDMEIHNEFL